jgi:GT2 family glycosyltransferase
LKIAIVILNWNGKDLLEKFLPSVIKFSNTELATIYIADNASTDDSISFIKDNHPSVQIIKNEKNYGYAKGYNVALRQVKEPIYALVNSDIEVTENWLNPILELFKKDENIAIIQPKILDYKDKSKFEYAGAGGGFVDKYAYPFCRGRIFDSIETDDGQYNDITDIFWASGACFFIRREVFHGLMGFDTDYFAHQEEIDLCWRAKNLGYKVKYNGLSTVYHVGGATLSHVNPQKTFLNFRNSLLNLVKNAPRKNLFIIILTRLILDGVAGVKLFLYLKPMHTFAIVKAHFSFYFYCNKMFKKRKIIPKKIDDYFLVKSIVYQYYVLKLKNFKELDETD